MQRRSSDAPGSGKFDAFRLAAERGVIEGTLDAVALPRVAERLVEERAPVRWRIEGSTDALGRPALALALEGELPLECQRCLGAYRWPVAQQTQVLLARSEAELAALDNDSELEVVLAAAPLDPAELVEDELVLAMPFAPRHPDGACAAAALNDTKT
jgi:uncharacterized protein